MSVVAIIYGEQSGIIRRFIHAARIEELAGHYGKGESIVILDAKEIEQSGKPDLYRGMEIVAEKRGKPAEDSRCIVIDNDSGEIVSVLLADPVLDVMPGKSLLQNAKAEPGWKLDDKGEYAASVDVADAVEAVAV